MNFTHEGIEEGKGGKTGQRNPSKCGDGARKRHPKIKKKVKNTKNVLERKSQKKKGGKKREKGQVI